MFLHLSPTRRRGRDYWSMSVTLVKNERYVNNCVGFEYEPLGRPLAP